MTADLEQYLPAQAISLVTQESDEAFVEWADGMDADELSDVGYVLTHMAKTSSLRAGWTAYQIRTQTPDGEWGRKVFDLAEGWEVSERTIHRWMSAAQSHFGLELTTAQKNAAASPPLTQRQHTEDTEDEGPDWDDEDDPFAGLDPDNGDSDLYDEETQRSLLAQMNSEAGWGDDTLPSADYENKLKNEDAQPAPRPMALEPDPTWIEFAAASIQSEHDNAYPEENARRMAIARWQGMLDKDPLGLLDQLEMIYESTGEILPDSTIVALHTAEDNKPIKPDAVEPPAGEKAKRGKTGPKLAYSQAEKILAAVRSLHEYVHIGLRDGTITDKEVAAILPHITPIPHTLGNLKKMGEECKKRYLASTEGAADRIAATQEAEAREIDKNGAVEVAEF